MLQKEDQAWIDWQKQFTTAYDEANYNNSLQTVAMNASHRLTEKPFRNSDHFGRVLEIGAGTGAHLPFVKHGFDQYILTDLNDAALEVARTKLAAQHVGKLDFQVQAGSRLNFEDNSFDRLIATHVLEHILEPHLVLREWARVLKKGGTLSVLIPTDPGMLWRFGRAIGPRRQAIAKGLAYDYIMAREHVNSCYNLLVFLNHYFPNATRFWWPFPVPSVNLNLFHAFHARVEK
jgi:phosphatidylethanolamine/phosphatidyl-N-methylethanolamine N-methyltransferase